jgi:hypothetical protein
LRGREEMENIISNKTFCVEMLGMVPYTCVEMVVMVPYYTCENSWNDSLQV